MEFYRHNSRRIPSVTGQVIPEPVFRQEDYEREILGRMYADVAPLDPDGILQDEFLNSRGAIPRFGRGSIEIRVIDVQESPSADLALAALAVGALRLLTEERLSPSPTRQAMAVPELASVFLECVRDGERAVVGDRAYLRSLGMGTGRAPPRRSGGTSSKRRPMPAFLDRRGKRTGSGLFFGADPWPARFSRPLNCRRAELRTLFRPPPMRVLSSSTEAWRHACRTGRSSLSEGRTLLITCEHGGNRIPKRYRSLFAGQEALLSSHRGWDPGALSLAQTLARSFHAPLHHSCTSRLLVDLNRSLHHPDLFSSITRQLPSEEREEILGGITGPTGIVSPPLSRAGSNLGRPFSTSPSTHSRRS